MTDYAKTYRGVPYFGVAFEETADAYGARAALEILANAVQATRDRDLRHDRDTLDAIAYLDEHTGGRAAPVKAFRAGLDIQHPVTRRKALADACRALSRIAAARIEVG